MLHATESMSSHAGQQNGEGAEDSVLPGESARLLGEPDSIYSSDEDNCEPPPRSWADIKSLLAFALPMALTRGGQGAMQQTNVMFVGHLGTHELGSAALGNLWATVTGRSVYLGSLSALDTLASQAFGAKSFKHIGTLTQRAVLMQTLICIPIGCCWAFFTKPVLTAAGIDPEQAAMAQDYSRILALGLWPEVMVCIIESFLQVQGITHAPMVVTFVAAVCNVGLNFVLVYGVGGQDGLGFIGSPICMVIINWSTFFALLLWVRCAGLHEKCWDGWSVWALRDWCVMIKLGLSGIAAVMGEWWAWEISTGFAGNLGAVPLAAHASLQNLTFYYYMPMTGFMQAATVRVGNALGAGRAKRAWEEVKTASLVVFLFELLLYVLSLFVLREKLAALYSSDPIVIEVATTALLPYLTHNLLDGVNGVLQAALRGCGRQQTTAKVSIFTWYVVALPLAFVLCFNAGLGVVGVWIGLMVGAWTTCIVQGFILKRLDWEAETQKAQN